MFRGTSGCVSGAATGSRREPWSAQIRRRRRPNEPAVSPSRFRLPRTDRSAYRFHQVCIESQFTRARELDLEVVRRQHQHRQTVHGPGVHRSATSNPSIPGIRQSSNTSLYGTPLARARSICSSAVGPSSASSTSAPRLESVSRRMSRLAEVVVDDECANPAQHHGHGWACPRRARPSESGSAR